MERDFLKNFVKFTGKHFCRILIFDKAACCSSSFYQKEIPTQVFSCKICKFLEFWYISASGPRPSYAALGSHPLTLISSPPRRLAWKLLKSDKACLESLNLSCLFYKHILLSFKFKFKLNPSYRFFLI